MKYIIYKTTCLINNKIYVGKHATENPDIFDGYLGNSLWVNRSDKLKNPEFPFHFAVKKYGVENFKRETLYVFDTEEEAYLKEAEIVNEAFVKREDTYNVTLGGRGGKHLPRPIYQFDFDGNLLQKFEYGLMQAGKTLEVSWTNIQDAINRKHQCTGYFWSYEQQINISEYKQPFRYHLYDEKGNYIKSCLTAAECGEFLECDKDLIYKNVNTSDHIKGVFISDKKLDKLTIVITPISGKLNRYTLDGKYIDSFKSVKEAKEILGLKLLNISTAIRKNGGVCNGFRWTRNDNPPESIAITTKSSAKKEVLVYNKNNELIKTYSSARECEKDYPSFRSTIYGRAKTCHGLIFKYK